MEPLTRTVSHADACAGSSKLCCNCRPLSCRVSDRNCRRCLCQCVPACIWKSAQIIIASGARSKPAAFSFRPGSKLEMKDEILERTYRMDLSLTSILFIIFRFVIINLERVLPLPNDREHPARMANQHDVAAINRDRDADVGEYG